MANYKPNVIMFLSFVTAVIFHSDLYGAEPEKCMINNVKGNVKLQHSCTYNSTLIITKSNTILDCQNAIIDGGNSVKFGIAILGKGKRINNVVVKNCIIKNFTNSGVRIASGVAISDLVKNSRSSNYNNSPNNITLDNIEVTNSGRDGIFVDSYSSAVTIMNSKITDSQMVGIYLEHSSRDNRIFNNIIARNGDNYGKSDKREGIAVDSSANNLIIGNKFIRNAAGGVFLYKNCGEASHTKNAITRWQHSDNNIIKNNYFQNENIGIWVASRQSKNLSRLDCGDSPIDNDKKYYRDFADNNTIDGNIFCQGHMAIIIEGDSNNIINNKIDGDVKNNILIPTVKDKILTGKVISNNIKTNNTFISCGT
ncbi:UNVERIFIED_ORG: parallel beta-helix repeat protein [Rahnella aquatilis]